MEEMGIGKMGNGREGERMERMGWEDGEMEGWGEGMEEMGDGRRGGWDGILTFRVAPSSSLKPLWKHCHGYTQKYVSFITLYYSLDRRLRSNLYFKSKQQSLTVTYVAIKYS